MKATTKQIDRVYNIADQVGGGVRDDYSGRCMYGRRCYGIVCEGYDMATVKKLGNKYKLGTANQDSMGLQAIVYWPYLEA